MSLLDPFKGARFNSKDINTVSESSVYGNSRNCTVLNYTASTGVRLLLEHGVDMEIRDICSLERTALIWATEFGNVAVVELLLE